MDNEETGQLSSTTTKNETTGLSTHLCDSSFNNMIYHYRKFSLVMSDLKTIWLQKIKTGNQKPTICASPDWHHQLRCSLCAIMLIFCTDTLLLQSWCSPVTLCKGKANWSQQEFLIRAIQSSCLFVIALHQVLWDKFHSAETAGPHVHPETLPDQNFADGLATCTINVFLLISWD